VVKWALESITMNKASGGDGIPVELFQILEDDAVKVSYLAHVSLMSGSRLTLAFETKHLDHFTVLGLF
jgi:hypothetical protein